MNIGGVARLEDCSITEAGRSRLYSAEPTKYRILNISVICAVFFMWWGPTRMNKQQSEINNTVLVKGWSMESSTGCSW